MGINTKYVLASDLQSLFRNKLTGEALRNGKIYFWKDNARNVPKPVYQITGSPPNYSYTVLPNPLTLSAIGTPQYAGNDIVIYWLPYDSDEPNANVELYYVQVFDENNVPQFTREAWPNTGETAVAQQDFTNYVPNGQFLLHHDLPAYGNYVAGQIRQDITEIGQGYWTFERSNGTGATDLVTFERLTEASTPTTPGANPRYAARVQSQAAGTGYDYKYLALKFPSVNMFASDDQVYTFAFTGQTNAGISTVVELVLVKNFGTGGDAPTTVVKQTWNVQNDWDVYQTDDLIFGDNAGKNIGDNDDDYLQLCLAFPVGAPFDVSITDVLLTPNQVVISNYPTTTNAETIYRSVAGSQPTPSYTNADIYLPLLNGPNGLIPDYSHIGKITPLGHDKGITIGQLLCEGDRYEYIAYSSDGIPYARLGDKLWDATALAYIWGSGPGYFSSATQQSLPELRIVNNDGGSVTAISDGTAPHATGFTFLTAHTGDNYFCGALFDGVNTIAVVNQYEGTVVVANAHTSGFTIISDNMDFQYSGSPSTATAPNSQYRFYIEIPALPAAGTYFTFESLDGVTSKKWAFWFEVNGGGSAPVVAGYTNVKISIKSDESIATVSAIIQASLNGAQVSTVRTTAASTLTTGDYFNVDSTDDNYYVWYNIDSGGGDPAIVGKTGIETKINSTDDATAVAIATQTAINRKYYAVPDLRGFTIAGRDTRNTVDTVNGLGDYGKRFSYYQGFGEGSYNSFELDSIRAHNHEPSNGQQFIVQDGSGFDSGAGNPADAGANTGYAGNIQTNALNIALDFVINY